jgi:hypothetical protein
MWPSRTLVPSFANDMPFANKHGTNCGIRACFSQSLSRKRQSPLHKLFVL